MEEFVDENGITVPNIEIHMSLKTLHIKPFEFNKIYQIDWNKYNGKNIIDWGCQKKNGNLLKKYFIVISSIVCDDEEFYDNKFIIHAINEGPYNDIEPIQKITLDSKIMKEMYNKGNIKIVNNADEKAKALLLGLKI